MRREEIDRLLARLSSGEITPEERAALYDAALEDQALFEELFAEEALAEALSDEQLRDEFLIREAGRASVEAEFVAPAEAMAEASPRVVRMPEPVTPMKRRIPWWGWAVPAAVAASTVIGIFLFSGPERDVGVAQTRSAKAVEVAQAQPEKPKPEAAVPAAPPATAEPAKRVAVQQDKARQVAETPAVRDGIAGVLKKSEPVLMARSDEAKAVDLKVQASPPKPKEFSATAAAPAAPPPTAAMPVRADLGASAAGGRAADVESRPAPAQVAEFRTAAPPPQAEGRVARDAARNEVAVQARAKTVAAERDDALALRSSAALQSQDASGNWQDVQPGGRVARGAKLRVRLTAHESGAWTLTGEGGRTVHLAQNESTQLDLPAYSPGLNTVELTFRPGSAAVMRMRSVTEAGRLGRISIPFTIE